MRMIKRNIIFLALFFPIAGCNVYTKTHFKMLAPVSSPVPADTLYEVLGPAEGSSSQLNFFWAFPVTKRLSIPQAISEAVNSKGGDNLIEVKIWHERQIWVVGSIDIVYVKGIVIRYINKRKD